MNILEGGLDRAEVQQLIAFHLEQSQQNTGPRCAHALNIDGLRGPDIRFWTAWEGEQVLAIGALRRLSDTEGELKSMHTVQHIRRQGFGTMMLRHIIEVARAMGIRRLSLETGSWPYFEPAREFYRRNGFQDCAPFGDYRPDPNSVFMTMLIE